MNKKLLKTCQDLGISREAFDFLDDLNIEPGVEVLEVIRDLDISYTHKPPESDAQILAFKALRLAYKHLGITIILRIPGGRRRALALTELEKSCAMAMGAIAIDWIEPGDASG